MAIYRKGTRLLKTVPGIAPSNKKTAPVPSSGRVELLVSAAIIADAPIEIVKLAVTRVLAVLSNKYEFYELLIVTHGTFYSQNEAAFKELLLQRNLRCLVLRDGVGEYRAAVLAATETIGDIVLVLSAEEFPVLEPAEMLDTAVRTGGSVILQRKRRAGLIARLSGRILSVISGYDVDPRLLRSGAHHRASLNRVVKRADSEVALRFLPSAGQRASEVTVLSIDAPRPIRSRFRVRRRIGLASEVLTNAPPHLLRMLAGASFLVMLGSILFFVYAVSLYVFGFQLQPGWLTISLAVSGSTAFISLALGAISTALFQILNFLREDGGDEIQSEMDNTDLFREFRRVNVETLDDN